jgi:hypothetical protein
MFNEEQRRGCEEIVAEGQGFEHIFTVIYGVLLFRINCI